MSVSSRKKWMTPTCGQLQPTSTIVCNMPLTRSSGGDIQLKSAELCRASVGSLQKRRHRQRQQKQVCRLNVVRHLRKLPRNPHRSLIYFSWRCRCLFSNLYNGCCRSVQFTVLTLQHVKQWFMRAEAISNDTFIFDTAVSFFEAVWAMNTNE